MKSSAACNPSDSMTVTNFMEFRRNLSGFLEKASKDQEIIGVDTENSAWFS